MAIDDPELVPLLDRVQVALGALQQMLGLPGASEDIDAKVDPDPARSAMEGILRKYDAIASAAYEKDMKEYLSEHLQSLDRLGAELDEELALLSQADDGVGGEDLPEDVVF